MRRICLVLILAGFVAMFAVAQELSTQNAVGVVKLQLSRGAYHLVCLNVSKMDGGYCITNVIDPSVLESETTLFFFDEVSQRYSASETVLFGAWDPGTNVLQPGDSFWISVPGFAAQSNYEASLFGEVPMNPTSAVTLVPGFSFRALSYPTDMHITNSGLSAIAENEDTVFWWDNGWKSESWVFGAWDPGTNVIKVGQGILYKSFSPGDKTWTQSKPYLWP